MKKALLAITSLVVLCFLPRLGAADEVAPGLEGLDLRAEARLAMSFLDKRGITGVYVAFDPNATDASLQAACDDDGDPVVVVSDAMLRLVGQVTRLARYDQQNGAHTVEGYATYLVQSQAPGKRLLPPPAGTFATAAPAAPHERLFLSLVFLLGRELAHLRAGDLVCPHPTATTELGDAEWTTAEQAAAVRTARTLYPGDQLARDAAVVRMLRAHELDEEPALSLLAFFARFEAESAKTPARVVPSYVALHPGAARRAANVEAVASALRTGAP